MKHIRFATILSVIALAPSTALANSAPPQKCMVDPSPPTEAMVLAGQPHARLYIHPKHPDLCDDPQSGECKARGYILTGDSIAVGERCGDWAYISFQGKKTRTLGWVDKSLYASSEPPAKPLSPACGEAAKFFNQWLNMPEPSTIIIPSARSNIQKANALPAGVGGGPQVWSIEIADAQIGDKPIKVVSYSAGGTCYDSSTELWDRDYKKQIEIPTNGTDDSNTPIDPGDASGYSNEDLVRLRGKPFFMHVPRSTNNVKFWALAPDMTASPVCELVRVPREREVVSYAADNALCEAVAQDHVTEAGLTQIEQVEITDTALKKALGFESPSESVFLIAVGKADLYNAGKAESVGILQYGRDDGAGCGHSYSYEWPEVLNAQREPLPRTLDRNTVFEHAGQHSKLITFRGVTYFDTRTEDSDSSDAIPMHEVWKLTSAGSTKICRLNPVEYKAIVVP